MNKTIIIPIIISVIISVSISYYLNSPKTFINNNGTMSDNLNTEAIMEEPTEILSVRGHISEIKDNRYIIDTDDSLAFTINTNNKTLYGTSFVPTRVESETLYTTSTSNDKEVITKLNLKVGDYIEATSATNIKGKTEFTASMIKLIR